MHSLFKKVTLWGLAGILTIGLFALPSSVRRVDAKGGYANSSQASNTIANNITADDFAEATRLAASLPQPPIGSTVFVGSAAAWRYYANPYRPSNSWINPSYSMNGMWITGTAPFGYGNPSQATTVTYGSDPNNKYITTYFRTEFNIANLSQLQTLTVDLLHDDGAMVYLNGTMVANPNMGASRPKYGDLATACNAGVAESFSVPPSLLVAGKNVLTVEVHQCAKNSANMIFDASLYAQTNTPPAPTFAPTIPPVVPPGTNSGSLVKKGDAWRYFDQGQVPGVNWTAADFNDSAWKNGAAPLGYGNVGEATVVGYGPDPNNKYVTTYFRKAFSVTDPSQYNALTLNLMADDGAVVYLNGAVIANPNMPASGFGNNTIPSGCGNGLVTTVNVPAALLRQGVNVLAVEQHQCYVFGVSMIFDASLAGAFGGGVPPAPTNAPTQPPAQPTQPPAQPTQAPTQPPAAPTTAPTIIPAPTDGQMVRKSDNWRYFDQGQVPGANWTATGFNDSAWKNGQAPFGYGNVGEATSVNYGPDANNKFITTYFRKAFSVSDTSQVRALALEVVADDGAVVYLNGTVVAHVNMPASGFGNSTIPSACGNKIVTSVSVDPALIKQGANVLAVEQHQCYPNGTNMFFDASLSTNGSVPTNPTAIPTTAPTSAPTRQPTVAPTAAPTTQPSTGGLPPAPSGQKWALRWGDEFNGTSVDTSKWKINNLTRAEDPNKTWYIPQNVSELNGTLKLQVKHESYNNASYTGGMLESTGNYRRNLYGYYEARIKYNFVGPGFWANFWMCGVDRWPPEIDNEIVAHHPGAVYLANHYKDLAGVHKSTNQYASLDYNQWHTYGVLWLPGKPVQFYVDGKLAFTANSPYENPPNIDMYISLRAGAYYNSTWGGTPNSTTQYPGVAEYDYVHVYQAIN